MRGRDDGWMWIGPFFGLIWMGCGACDFYISLPCWFPLNIHIESIVPSRDLCGTI